MKPIVSLLLALLFASCGKQEVYEFEKSTTFEPEKIYRADQNGTIVNFKYYHGVFDDRYPTIVEKFPLRTYTRFKFEPIDEDGFCFFSYNGSISPHTDPEQKYRIDDEVISEVVFFDENKNQLFSFPFDDEYDVQDRASNYSVRGKTKLVTRTLLEKVDIEKTEISVNYEIEKKYWHKVRDIYESNSSK
jgi:hypothetical protein